ncbi:MAG: TonB-dependent receptor plug domain-containing protein [Bacteroidales bacterium]|nr:TonB-dependent receptor plug domain-containing protein [Bacteroidales bacterium]
MPRKLRMFLFQTLRLALQGKLSGVRIYNTQGGQPGADASILVRGGSSINKSNDPLIIVDGMVKIYFEDINPNDIETVQVLKDASSTAIYGARASNENCIGDNEKEASRARLRFTFNMNSGFASPWKYMNTVGAEDYLGIVRPAVLRSSMAGNLTKTFPWVQATLRVRHGVPGSLVMENQYLRVGSRCLIRLILQKPSYFRIMIFRM